MRPAAPALHVERVTGAVLVEDLGRRHLASGVPVSGAFDRRAHAAATLLVGGRPGDATLEVLGQVRLRAEGPLLVAVTGRAQAAIDGVGIPVWTAVDLRDGESLEVATPGRAYVGVRGGLDVPLVLGSRSTCLMGPIGPPPVREGDRIRVGPHRGRDARAGDFCRPPSTSNVTRVVPGPHARLTRVSVEIAATSRIGVRLSATLAGVSIERSRGLASMGVLPGTIQALPSGDWMLLGPDAGTMGGYPVVGVVAGDDLDPWAHARPGDVRTLVSVRPGSIEVVPMDPVVRIGELG